MPQPNKIVDKSHIELSYITHFYGSQKNIGSVVSLLRKYVRILST